MRTRILTISLILACQPAQAGRILDYLREYNLNDYAVGVAVSGSQNPYAGADNSTIVYPFLTSFRDSTMTDDWFIAREGDIGARWVNQAGLELGVVGRVQTLGLGNHDSDTLRGISDREWTIEMGPTIGWRRWPVQVYWKTYAEVTDRHEGLISQLQLALPKSWSRGYVVPSVELIHQTSDYTNYYYSVTDAEATPSRPAYVPGAATNYAIKARWGYALSDKWLLSGAVGVEYLDSSITNSPITDRDDIWSARIGLAYNADVFRRVEYDSDLPRYPNFDIRVGAFYDSIDTRITRDTADGIPGDEVDIEDVFGVDEDKAVLQVDLKIQLARYHRLEFGYFEIGRDSRTVLAQDIEFGDEIFLAGTEITTVVDARVFKATYAFSLFEDAQKELSVVAGVHVTDLRASLTAESIGQAEKSDTGTPLPVIGLNAAIFLADRTTLAATVQVFRTDFDHYEGSLNYGALDLEHRLTDHMSIGVGYNYYGMKLTSSSADVNGYLRIKHHGPAVFFAINY